MIEKWETDPSPGKKTITRRKYEQHVQFNALSPISKVVKISESG